MIPVLFTGGTISMRHDPAAGGAVPALGARDILAAVRKQDVLLQHPYDSFSTSVQAFIEQAAADPHVLAIKQTLYRAGKQSAIVDALVAAAEAGAFGVHPALLDAAVVDVMEAPFAAVAAEDRVSDAVALLAGDDRVALTVTVDGRAAGIVTRADLLEALAR